MKGLLFVCTVILIAPSILQAQNRSFQGRDSNADGVITRDEWRGSSRSYSRHDRNGDGVLAGSEVPGWRGNDERQVRSRAGRLDQNRSGAVEQYEWPYNLEVFDELDRNRDGAIVPSELNDMTRVTIAKLDQNRNRRIDADEWPGGFAEFRELDQNRDGRISSQEYYERGNDWQRRRRFNAWDANRDNLIQSREWQTDDALFTRLDVNRDKKLDWAEFNSNPTEWARNQADRLDRNSSGRVEGYEWPYNRELFHQLDTDADSTLSQEELRNITRATLGKLDSNRNGQIEEQEWPGGFADFQQLDQNRDGRVSAREYFDRGGEWQKQQRFRAWDANRDGIIQSTEWKSDNDLFHRLDTNANSQLEWEEFRSSGTQRSRTY